MTESTPVEKNLSSPALLTWGPPALLLLASALIFFTDSNVIIFLRLNHLSFYTGDALWAYLTILGDGLITAVLLLPLVRRRPDIVWAMAIALIVSTIWVQVLKSSFGVPRPPQVLDPSLIHVIGPRHGARAFPSGHTATIFAAAGSVALAVTSIRWRTLLVVMALAVGVSRAVVGVHWPLDIAVGALGGWLAAILGHHFAGRRTWSKARRGRLVLEVLLLIAAAVTLVIDHTGYSQAVWFQRAIAATCLTWFGVQVIESRRRSKAT
jgi:membrane-associated phospholipid phosphatase